ncbi:MAG: hypothetical protein ACYDAY_00725 [Candidatus Dormibacteria bacterium]
MANKRVSLIGSDELFRPTRTEPVLPLGEAAQTIRAVAIEPDPPEPRGDALEPARTASREAIHTLLVTGDELEMLHEAVQKEKHPNRVKPNAKPSIEIYEALERLRQKILGALNP